VHGSASGEGAHKLHPLAGEWALKARSPSASPPADILAMRSAYPTPECQPRANLTLWRHAMPGSVFTCVDTEGSRLPGASGRDPLPALVGKLARREGPLQKPASGSDSSSHSN
jgi:hypothetical protein